MDSFFDYPKLYSVVLVDNARPIVKTLPSIFSPHIASIQSLVKMHTSFPLIACGNTSGRIVALMNNQKYSVCLIIGISNYKL